MTARGTSLTATDSVTVRVAVAAVVSSVTLVSKPVDGGGTYKQGEKIEAAVTFSKPVTVTGIPQLTLAVGAAAPLASYVRGSGTNRLVFEYTVQSGDTDGDGIAIAANSLTPLPTGATIVDANGADAISTTPALAAQTGHKVDGSLTHSFDLTGGICERTPQLRDKLLALVRANESDNTLTCAQVGNTRLGALTGTLNLDGSGPWRQPHDRPQGRRLRRAHGHHESRTGQQPAARHPGRRVRPADGADEFEPGTPTALRRTTA